MKPTRARNTKARPDVPSHHGHAAPIRRVGCIEAANRFGDWNTTHPAATGRPVAVQKQTP